MSDAECLEGIMDLAVFDPAAGSWLPYETAALAAEWERLRRAPPEIAQALGER